MAARLNYVITYEQLLPGKEIGLDVQRWLFDHFLSDSLKALVERHFGKDWSSKYVLVSRHQLAILARLAAGGSPSTQRRSFQNREDRFEFGFAALIVNDHLASAAQLRGLKAPTLLWRKRHLALQMAFFLELYNPVPLREALVRSEHLLNGLPEISSRVPVVGGLAASLGALFEEASGINLEDYRDILLVILFRYLSTNPGEVLQEPDRLLFHRQGYLRNLHLPQGSFDSVLRLESRPVAELQQCLAAPGAFAPNLEVMELRIRPVVELGDDYFLAIDIAWLVERLGYGFRWAIANAIPDQATRHEALTLFGKLFEEYVGSLLEKAYGTESGRFRRTPTNRRREELCDGLLMYGDHLILFEYKSASLLAVGKYSGRWRPFAKALDAQFGAGPDGALTQLAAALERMFHRNPALRTSPDGVDLTPVTKVSPVLIVNEEFLAGPLMNWHLQARFRKALSKRRVTASVDVRPVTVLDVRTLEILLRSISAGQMRFDQAINARLARDPEVETSFHEAMLGLFPDSYGKVRDPAFDAVQDRVFERTAAKLFGPEEARSIVERESGDVAD